MIRVVADDLASLPTDAVVRPTTDRLEPITPELRRLEQLGGPTLWKQLRVSKPLEVGVAVVTAGGDLPAEFVINAVIRSDQEPVTPDGVRHAIKSVLQRATDWGLGTITTPLIGVGAGNLDVEDAARILIDVLASDLPHATHPSEVCIVVESDVDREIVEAFLRSRITQ